MRADEYLALDALGLAERLRKKEVSPAEVLAAAEARCDAVNPKINAVIHRFAANAIGELPAEPSVAPFWGVPFLVKDLDGTLANAPFCGGSRALRDYQAPTDSDLFRRYKEIGLAIFGKTNTPEFGIVAFTEPELFGATKNPWNLDHTPGGSSGGSAAAVAAGIVPVAHAGDGGGSIRIPASACGLFGLKPTRGRMPLGPVGEGWNGLVVPHVVSRTVRDSAAFLDATWADPRRGDVGAPYGPPPAPYPGNFLAAVTKIPRRLRIGFTSQSIFGKDTHADCTHALGEAMRACEALGHDVFETTLPLPAHGPHGRDALRRAYLVIVAAGVSAAVRETTRLTGRRVDAANFEPATWFLHQLGEALSAVDLEEARGTMFAATRAVSAAFSTLSAPTDGTFDLLATPTLAHPPARIGELALKPAERAGLALLRRAPVRALLERALDDLSKASFEKTPNTMLFNMTGQPAMSLPLHVNRHNLPIGVQFVAPFGDEATLLSLAGQLEASAPWAGRYPKL
jgi:amidase